mgnify:CR=1 FL=1
MRLLFNEYPEIMAGLSERSDGSMVWWNRLPVDEAVRGNRERYFRGLGISPERVVAGGLVSGVRVAVVSEKEAGEYLLNTDALLTNIPGLFLTVTASDCLPVYFYDMKMRCLGIAHAGWRGLVNGILEKVVFEFNNSFGSEAADLRIIIGPHIKSCHYEVGEDVAAQFSGQNLERRNGRIYVKLADEVESRLRALGVKHISVSPVCTYEDKRFYSARRDKSEPLKGMAAYLGAT